MPWSRFVSANQDVSHREAGKLQQGVQSQVDKATQGREAAQAAQESGIASNYSKQPAQFSNPSTGAASSFGSPSPTTKPFGTPAKPAAPAPPKQIDPDRLNTQIGDGGFKTGAGDLAGGKDLESQLGTEKWQSLVGDTQKAQQAANALGSESGVQALLGKGSSPFDAALISGAGGKDFRDMSKRFGGDQLSKSLQGANESAQGRWQSLMDDVTKAGMDRDAQIQAATDQMNAANAANASAPAAAATTPTATGPTYKPGGYESYEDFKSKLGFGTDIHNTGTSFDPLQGLTNDAGRAGIYSGHSPAEMFRGVTGNALDSVAGSLDDQNRLDAFRQIESQYGPEAAKYLWDTMTSGIWDGMAGQNSGAMYRTLAGIVDAAIEQGNVKRREVTDKTTPESEGYSSTVPPPVTTQQGEEPPPETYYG